MIFHMYRGIPKTCTASLEYLPMIARDDVRENVNRSATVVSTWMITAKLLSNNACKFEKKNETGKATSSADVEFVLFKPKTKLY